MAAVFVSATNAGAADSQPAAKEDPGHAPYAPFRIGDGLYYVGSADYASYLIVTRAGLLVIDGGDAVTGQQVLANIRTLGFDPAKIRILLNTHQHFDHAAGLAALQKASGAKLYASAADGPIIAAGGRGDPFLKGERFYYDPVKPAGTLADGQKISFGGWTLTAHVTGGHTRGCTTWTFPVTVAGKVRQALVHCSSSVLPGYKLGKVETYPGQTQDYQRSFATWKALPCEVFLASHGAFFDLQAKRRALDAGKADAFVDPQGCRAFYAKADAAFRTELARQNP